jgi:hypothetical protein
MGNLLIILSYIIFGGYLSGYQGRCQEFNLGGCGACYFTGYTTDGNLSFITQTLSCNGKFVASCKRSLCTGSAKSSIAAEFYREGIINTEIG